MRPARLISRYPVLYHTAEDGSFESILRLGLLSTSALLDRFGVEGQRRFEIESSRKPEMVELVHPEQGRALVRDNKPMQERVLARCLVGMEPRKWYETLNRRVFFWVDRERLVRLLGAQAYKDQPHVVLELDTEGLLRRHSRGLALRHQLRRYLRHEPGQARSRNLPPHRRVPSGRPGGRAHR